ncbi:MAG: hypothetical protein ACM3ZF_07700 [Mycobacterium leprae]
MTVALASTIDDLELPPEPGVSTRAVRAVLRMMAKIANETGLFRYGLRGSKLALLTEYSLSVVRRAQRYLVEHGFVERVQVGGGRASTRWRIVLHRIRPDLASGHSSSVGETQQPDPPDTAQEHTPKFFLRMHQGSAEERSSTPPPLLRVIKTCEHGGEIGVLRSGLPRCPSCRHNRMQPGGRQS